MSGFTRGFGLVALLLTVGIVLLLSWTIMTTGPGGSVFGSAEASLGDKSRGSKRSGKNWSPLLS